MRKLSKYIFTFGLATLAMGLLFGVFNPSVALGQSTPSVDLKIDGQDGSITIPYNTSVLLSWTTENVNSCRASGDWSGVRSLNGAQSPSRITSAKTFTLTCDGVSDSVSVDVANIQLPVITINAFPSTISIGETSAITWNAQDADRCTASGGWSGSRSLSGSKNVSPTVNTTYTLACSNAAGSTSANTTVTLQNAQGNNLPSIDLDAQPRSIEKGETSVISWSVNNAKRCVASGGWSGTKSASSGTRSVRPEVLTLYTLTCNNDFGSVSAHVNVLLRNVIEPKPTIDIKIQPVQIHKGENAVILWNTTNADRCNAVGGWSGRKSDSGAETITATQNTIYTLICTNDDGSTSRSQTLFIKTTATNPPATTNFVASCVASPSRATVGQRVSFAAGQTGGETPVRYRWSGDISGNSQLQSTAFTSAGTKRATVSITDSQGVTKQSSCSTLIIPATITTTSTKTPPPAKATTPRALEILSYESITNIDTSGIKPLLASITGGIGKILWYMFIVLVNIALIFLLLYLARKLKQKIKPLTPATRDEN